MKLVDSVMKRLDFNVTVYVTVGLFDPLAGQGTSAKIPIKSGENGI
jgi:hypothetical protein